MMISRRPLGFFALCAALVACEGSAPVLAVTGPEPGSPSFDAVAADPGSALALYDWADVALDEGAISEQGVGTQQAATGGRATGHYRLSTPTGNRAAEQYSFTALSTGPVPTAKGEVELHTLFTFGTEAKVHIDVDCLVIVGNQAWFSGPARRFVFGGVVQPPGLYLIFRVQDNGEGENDPPDRGSPAFSGPPMGCRLQPPFPLVPTANGNIQVRQR